MGKSVANITSVQTSRFGKGLFATENISEDFPLFKITGKKVKFIDSIELGEKESYCLQIGIDKYIIPDDPFIYINHSCNPNCGINSKIEFNTLRPICKGEEITWDYSTSMLERHWTLDCHCGSKSCRQLITDFDLLPKHIQCHYLELDIVLPYLISYLKNLPVSINSKQLNV